MGIFYSVEQLIGHTPLLSLEQIKSELELNANILAKLEMFNPGGSAKDRIAKEMLNMAEEKGVISSRSTIIEPTSGNTGIGLASVGAARGYRVIIVMPENMSEERKLLMRAYGAELVLTPGGEGMTGAIAKAKELAETIPQSFIPGQFDNMDNVMAHYKTTGPEIWENTDGKVDVLVAGVGTGGTLTGTGKYLKEMDPEIKVIAVEPERSPLLSGGMAGSHGLQGIGANFIPKILDTNLYDEVITVSDENAYNTARLVSKKEGILVGISAGAAMWAAIQLAQMEEYFGKNIVVIMPDSGERYLSTGLYSE